MRQTRRAFLRTTLVAGAALGAPAAILRSALAQAPAVVTSDASRPTMPYGVQSGDVVRDRVIVWSRADRSARMFVEWATTDSFRDLGRVPGPAALEDTDFTARVDLGGLPAGQRIFYRVIFQDLADGKTLSAPVSGSFRTPPAGRRDVVFAWSGDEAGQGWASTACGAA
jgi:alkaline phosphatase D